MSLYKLVAFDCDGVMFDTRTANTSYYNEILHFLGKPPLTPEQFKFAHMHTVDETLAFLTDCPDELERAKTFRKTMGYMPFIKDMIAEPYLKPLLKKIKPVVKTAVATNRSDTMDHVLREHGLEQCFDLVVTSLDVENPKPHPESLIKILRHFSLKPGECLYIGDSKLDEMAAKGALVPFAAYDNPGLAADYHINDLAEVVSLLGLGK
ncbi:MAG: HAD-IA family hydrolase [Desulfobacterales bacterium]